jgi:hypothetical protein
LRASLQSGWEPDLRRLEGINDFNKFTPADYRESWYWVHWLMNNQETKAILSEYLRELRHGRNISLSDRLEQWNPATNELFKQSLREHVIPSTPEVGDEIFPRHPPSFWNQIRRWMVR